jgi:hypothetical protein
MLSLSEGAKLAGQSKFSSSTVPFNFYLSIRFSNGSLFLAISPADALANPPSGPTPDYYGMVALPVQLW